MRQHIAGPGLPWRLQQTRHTPLTIDTDRDRLCFRSMHPELKLHREKFTASPFRLDLQAGTGDFTDQACGKILVTVEETPTHVDSKQILSFYTGMGA